MDYGLLPPEINSGRMYAGPGAGSMLTAANAWDGLATVLHSVADSYASVLASLAAESWLGLASASMVAAVAPFARWLGAAAALAEQAGNQARRASGAFDVAFAMTVPPPLITANRSQLTSLAAANILGQNSPAIEALQAEYTEMWAQDAAAMFNYAAASESASTLTAFSPPSQFADPWGPMGQAQAVGASAGQSAASTQATLGAAFTDTQSLAAPAAPLDSLFATLGFPSPIQDLDIAGIYIALIGSASLALAIVNTNRPWSFQIGQRGVADPNGALVPTQTLGAVSGTLAATPAPIGGTASAGVGHGALIGGLKVPHSWTMAAPEIRLAVQSLPGAGVGPVQTELGGVPAGLLSGMALAGLAGRGGTGVGPRTPHDDATEEQPQRKPTVVVIQQPAGGPGSEGNRQV